MTDEQAVLDAIPDTIDYIVDFVGAPSNDPQEFIKTEPAARSRDAGRGGKAACEGDGLHRWNPGPKEVYHGEKGTHRIPSGEFGSVGLR